MSGHISDDSIVKAIRRKAVEDGQFATAFALLELAETIASVGRALDRSCGVETWRAIKEAGEATASALNGLGTSLETGLREVADAIERAPPKID